jgi:hypothetical protein
MSTKETLFPSTFSDEQIRAILSGTKTQHRLLVNPQPDEDGLVKVIDGPWHDTDGRSYICPFGVPGDRFWVQETYCEFPGDAPDGMGHNIYYRADHGNLSDMAVVTMRRNGVEWRPEIQMPRSASRILLETTDVRVERLWEISANDCRAEGHPADWSRSSDPEVHDGAARDWYMDLWKSINGADSWNANPWVWVVSFRMIDGGVVA